MDKSPVTARKVKTHADNNKGVYDAIEWQQKENGRLHNLESKAKPTISTVETQKDNAQKNFEKKGKVYTRTPIGKGY